MSYQGPGSSRPPTPRTRTASRTDLPRLCRANLTGAGARAERVPPVAGCRSLARPFARPHRESHRRHHSDVAKAAHGDYSGARTGKCTRVPSDLLTAPRTPLRPLWSGSAFTHGSDAREARFLARWLSGALLVRLRLPGAFPYRYAGGSSILAVVDSTTTGNPALTQWGGISLSPACRIRPRRRQVERAHQGTWTTRFAYFVAQNP